MWPAGSPFPPTAPWIAASVDRSTAARLCASSYEVVVDGGSKKVWVPPEYCDNPILLIIVEILFLLACRDYCTGFGIESFEVDRETCSFDCRCRDRVTGGGPGPRGWFPPGGDIVGGPGEGPPEGEVIHVADDW